MFCSTSRPAYIFQHPDFYSSKGGASNYLAHLLNPDGQSFYGYNRPSYSIYWATCHSLVGPNFFSPEMVTKSIELGYPGNLHEEQIQLGHPLDIFSLISFLHQHQKNATTMSLNRQICHISWAKVATFSIHFWTSMFLVDYVEILLCSSQAYHWSNLLLESLEAGLALTKLDCTSGARS